MKKTKQAIHLENTMFFHAQVSANPQLDSKDWSELAARQLGLTVISRILTEPGFDPAAALPELIKITLMEVNVFLPDVMKRLKDRMKSGNFFGETADPGLKIDLGKTPTVGEA